MAFIKIIRKECNFGFSFRIRAVVFFLPSFILLTHSHLPLCSKKRHVSNKNFKNNIIWIFYFLHLSASSSSRIIK